VALLDGLHDRKAFIMANRYRAILNKFMNWCADKGYIEEVPAMPKPGKEKSRDRILSDQQLIDVWQGVEATNNIFQPFVKLLILTGQRRSELSYMRWKELHNLDAANPYWTIPAENAKNGQAHDVPLSPQAMNVIKSIPHSVNSQYCFATNRQTPISGISKMKAKLDQTIKNICDQDGRDPVTAWKLHDLRRTAASGMAGLNVSPHVVEKILNHTSGTISGVAAVYNRYDYAQEKRAALDKWGEYVESLVTGKKAQEDNIIPLYQKEAFS
jgi:integrase